jgi:hypothetical protein
MTRVSFTPRKHLAYTNSNWNYSIEAGYPWPERTTLVIWCQQCRTTVGPTAGRV